MTLNLSAQVRFERAVLRRPDGCWIWRQKARTRPSGGYARIRINNRKVLAHRFSWELARGPVPPGLFVLHRCDVRDCVNPDHLFLGTLQDNMDDMVAKGRAVSPNAFKTHCKRGHEFTPENTINRPNGRACRTCVNAGCIRRYQDRRFFERRFQK
ncbi:MAG: HNH endonuclease signature motif containing protein [Gemmatimonadaceae bacterium]